MTKNEFGWAKTEGFLYGLLQQIKPEEPPHPSPEPCPDSVFAALTLKSGESVPMPPDFPDGTGLKRGE